jgi:hypothetical protein
MDVTVLATSSGSQRNGMDCCNGADRERSEGRESGQSKESRVCVEDCKACKIIYNKGQAKQTGELSFVDSNRKRKV